MNPQYINALQAYTTYFIIIVSIIVALFDLIIVCLAGGEVGVSISYKLYKWSRDFPIIPLVIGIILGHLFWPVIKIE